MYDAYLPTYFCTEDAYYSTLIKCPVSGYSVNNMPTINIENQKGKAYRFNPQEYFIFPVALNDTEPNYGYFGFMKVFYKH